MIGRLWALATVTVVSLVLGVSTADASITLGQLAPTPTTGCAGGPVELLQPTVTSGNGYVAPAQGTITSWSTVGPSSAGGGQMKLKVWRKVSDPATFRVVAQTGFQTIPTGTLKTFPVTVPGIEAGDVIGLTFQGNVGCDFAVTGDHFLNIGGDFADGDGAIFANTAPNFRINITADLDPSHKFALGAVTRNKKRGTATLTGTFPGPGSVTLTGKGLKGAGTAIPVPGTGDVGLPIKAAGSKRATLFDTGKVTLNVSASYTPTGGSAGTAATKVKLRKKL